MNLIKKIIAVDLAKEVDYTAISVSSVIQNENSERFLYLENIERMQLGTSYTTVIEYIKVLYEQYGELTDIVIDRSGVGNAVYEFLAKDFRKRPFGVIITGGERSTGLNVPKKTLITNLQIAFETRKILISKEINDLQLFIDELLAYRHKISKAGNDLFDAESGDHDDMVISLALAYHIFQKYYKLIRY